MTTSETYDPSLDGGFEDHCWKDVVDWTTMAEECCFDRSLISHKVTLFDLHHKYADVMHLDDLLGRLANLAKKETTR